MSAASISSRIGLLLLGLMMLSCLDNPPEPDRGDEPEQTIAVAYYFTALDISGPSSNLNVIHREGDKLVFKYYCTTREPKKLAILLVEVDRNQDQFSMGNFSQGRAVYATLNQEEKLVYNYVNRGSISGRKLNNEQWEVNCSIEGGSNLPLDLSFNEVFIIR